MTPALKQQDNSWLAEVALVKVPLGDNRLMIGATDNVGNSSKFQKRQIKVVSVEQLAKSNAMKKFKVSGAIQFYGNAVPDAKVQLLEKGVPVASVLSDAGGEFQFKEIAAGKYKMVVQALIRNKPRFSTTDVTLGLDKPAVGILSVDLK